MHNTAYERCIQKISQPVKYALPFQSKAPRIQQDYPLAVLLPIDKFRMGHCIIPAAQ